MRLERRTSPAAGALLLAPLAAIAFTLAVTSLLVAWAGAPVGRAYALLLEGGVARVSVSVIAKREPKPPSSSRA